MTRTVRDTALMLTVMAGAHSRDRCSVSTGIDYLSAIDGDIAGLRVGWSPYLGYAPIDPEVREIASRAASRFNELGCHVEEVQPNIPDPWENIVSIIWGAAFAGVFQDNLEEVRDKIDPGLLTVIEEGQTYSAHNYREHMPNETDTTMSGATSWIVTTCF